PADDVAGGLGDDDAVDAVGQAGGAAGRGADEVALDLVAAGARHADEHAPARVAGDDVAGQPGGAADQVAAGPAEQLDAVQGVRQGTGGGDAGADAVGLDEVARGAEAGQ